MNSLPSLFFQKYRFSLEVTSPMMLPPYKGSTFRGGLLTAFKREICFMPSDNRKLSECKNCPLTESCSYYKLFGSYDFASSLGVSMPYIIEPPLTERKMFDTGEEVEFSVVLIGKATRYWKPLVVAVKQLGETSGLGRKINGGRGNFILKRVDSVGLGNSYVTIYSAEHEFHHDEPIMLMEKDFTRTEDVELQQFEQDALSENKYRLRFLTHVRFLVKIQRIKDLVTNNVRFRVEKFDKDNYLITDFEFAFLIQELFHRLGGLSEAYCDGHRLDRYHLIERVSDIRSKSYLVRRKMERYSSRQDRRYSMDGLKGFLRLEGDLEPFLPYLRLGEWLHIGKEPNFGLGQYQLLAIDEQG